MITSNFYATRQSAEYRIICHNTARSGDSMIHFRKIGQLTTKHFANSLMTQTHTKYRFATSIMTNNCQQQTCLRGNTRSGTEDNLIVLFQLFQLKLVVTYYADCCSQLLQQMRQIVGKRVVVVNNHYIHNSS